MPQYWHSRAMFQRIAKLISFIFFILGCIGLFTIPEDWPIFVRRTVAVAIWFDRETILLTLFALSSLGFVLILVEPYFGKWVAKRRNTVFAIIPPTGRQQIRIDPISDCPGTGHYTRVYKIGVKNISPATQTLKSVQVSFSETGPYGRLLLFGDKENRTSTDLHPGETALFFLGETDLGNGSAVNVFDDNEERYATSTNLKLVTSRGMAYMASSLVSGEERERLERANAGVMKADINLVVSAENTPSVDVKYFIEFNMKTAKTSLHEWTEDYTSNFSLRPGPNV